MTTRLVRIRSFVIIAFAVLMMIAENPALAQQLGPDGAPNPTASVASEQKLLQQSPRIEGQIDPSKREGACPHATRRAAMGSFP